MQVVTLQVQDPEKVMRGLIYIVCLLIITGCTLSSPRARELDEAQLLLQSDPGAAMSKLNQVDVAALEDSATMARWALLYSEAMVINRLSAPTDTIVNIAIDYYGRHNLKDEFRKASRLKALMMNKEPSDALATALYLQKEREFFLYKERVKNERFLMVGLVILLIAGGVIVGMRQRMKVQSLQNDALIAEASGLRAQIEAGRGDMDRMREKLQGLLEKRFGLIDSLCQTYYESQGTKVERKAIVDKVKSEIEAVREGAFAEMERTVNDCRDNLLEKVRTVYPAIKDEDYHLLVYLASRLSPRTISLLLGESVEVVYKRKSRLKARMKEAVEPSCPAIMEVF